MRDRSFTPGDLWTIGFAERLCFPRLAAQSGEMLAFAHNSTGANSRGEIDYWISKEKSPGTGLE